MRQYGDKKAFTISFDEQTLPVIEQISEGMPGGFLYTMQMAVGS